MLNTDQENAVKQIMVWLDSRDSFLILEGRGGTGKTFLLENLLNKVDKNLNSLLLAPTHEALNNLREKTGNKYVYKTCDAALGIRPIFGSSGKSFIPSRLPDIWNNTDFAIIDEISMLSLTHLGLLKSLGIKILFIGHRAQLPPIEIKRSIKDDCVSPIFKENINIITLKQPMRNSGALWDFLNVLEDSIHSGAKILSTPYDVSLSKLNSYLESNQGIDDFKTGKSKLVLWTNKGVSDFNARIRRILWKENADTKYLPGDYVILTAPLVPVDRQDLKLSKLKNLMSRDSNFLYSNSKGIVLNKTTITSIQLDHNLTVQAYEVVIQIGDKEYVTFELVEGYREILNKYLEKLAWACSSKIAKEKAYKFLYFVDSCFVNLHHYYAATAHRLQGATVENIVYVDPDVRKNPNPIERAKCRYVGCSRASKNLLYYGG